ncbi:MAG: VWA domain-containing protein, partial [Pricia sp.]|nr:VWA domain-containing protein [Pricia sp.]
PPLIGNLGEVVLTGPNEVLLNQRIRGVIIDEPLLVLFKDDLEREAILFGENIWKWRIQSYRNDADFKNFDDLIGKIILYLATNITRERLTVDYNSVYQGSTEAIISATYFDETFVFDENATILLRVKNTDTETSLEMPMLLKGRYYEADLSNLAPGNYGFTATVTNENLSESGRFTILDFDIEKQFLSTDYRKLGRLAQNTEAELYFSSQKDDLMTTLMEDTRFLPIQKSKQNVVSLIDFRILLAIIVAALALEWFIRKYNGLI